MIVIKIGYCAYVIKKESDAAAVIRALAGAVQCDSEWAGDHEVFFPAERPREISMMQVDQRFFRNSRRPKADDIDVDTAPLAMVRRVK